MNSRCDAAWHSQDHGAEFAAGIDRGTELYPGDLDRPPRSQCTRPSAEVPNQFLRARTAGAGTAMPCPGPPSGTYLPLRDDCSTGRRCPTTGTPAAGSQTIGRTCLFSLEEARARRADMGNPQEVFL